MSELIIEAKTQPAIIDVMTLYLPAKILIFLQNGIRMELITLTLHENHTIFTDKSHYLHCRLDNIKKRYTSGTSGILLENYKSKKEQITLAYNVDLFFVGVTIITVKKGKTTL
ncbi:hypothetical protein ACFQZR_13680 [Paenibacillus sp. GCM10027629]|uniref:hypothetical protein n=1 Tax=Paenibacillus sp. GCM10027629 TaxID=3273414 RepID=UPI00362A8D58